MGVMLIKKAVPSFILVLMLNLILGCATSQVSHDAQSVIDPDQESALENYQDPTLISKPQITTINGSVLVKDKIPMPLNNIKVIVFSSHKNDEILYETKTNSGGRFSLQTNLKTGDYTIKILDDKWKGHTSIIIDRFENRDIVVYAEK